MLLYFIAIIIRVYVSLGIMQMALLVGAWYVRTVFRQMRYTKDLAKFILTFEFGR